MITNSFKTVLFVFLLCQATFLFAQEKTDIPITAFVEPDSGQEAIKVLDLKLDFKFGGYGVYIPADYPTLKEIPLENGEIVHLDHIAEMTLRPKRVHWKKFIAEDQRKDYKDIDAEGYRHYSTVEVEAELRDWDGTVSKSRIKRPEYADVYLKGKTPHGEFSLQIDQENGKTVHLTFEPAFILQCPKDKSHLFPNSKYKYCPYCGTKLKRIENPAAK